MKSRSRLLTPCHLAVFALFSLVLMAVLVSAMTPVTLINSLVSLLT